MLRVKASPRELPPRARRILLIQRGFQGDPGTTSACAENTIARDAGVQPRRNYLRVRGEYRLHIRYRVCGLELPPRARRIPGYLAATPRVSGTTSACAENTLRVQTTRMHDRNYLRVRGEYSPRSGEQPDPGELPPRARRIRVRV